MSIKTTNIVTSTNVNVTSSNTWSNGTSNIKKSINDKISPITQLNINSVEDVLSSTTNIQDKVKLKISKNVTGTVLNNLSNSLDISSTSLSSNTNSLLNNNIVNKITKQLTSPGLPLNLKNKLSKAIKSICDADGKLQLDFNDDLSSALSGLGLDELLKLVACLSDPSKLVSTAISLLMSTLPSMQIKDGLNTTIKTGKLDTDSLLTITNDNNGKTIIDSNRDLLESLNNDTDTKKNIVSTDANLLYTNLPSDQDSMCVYGNNKNGLYNMLIDKQNNNKLKNDLINTVPPLDTTSKEKIFMFSYNNDNSKTILN